jgi:hypothetical protein
MTGVPTDAEYLMFIVDTSGSMRRYEWDRVASMLRETLDLYPRVLGIQVINDQGDPLLLSYRDEWIPDTPSNREWILDELGDWDDYSESNPRLGLLSAIDRYSDPEKAIALFVLSDDFAPGAAAIDPLVAEVAARNREGADSVPRLRIHTLAFPVFYDVLGRDQFMASTGADLAMLMSTLSQQNDGSFMALSSRHSRDGTAATGAVQDPLPAVGNRVLILVDASANMREPDWRQAVDTVEWLLAYGATAFQVMTLTDSAQSAIAGTAGQWLTDADGSLRERVVASLRDRTPAGTLQLDAIFAAVSGFDLAPDSIYLLAATDPTIGPGNYPQVQAGNPGDAPLDVLLFAAADNPRAVPFYWGLALAGGGSLVAPSEDWP